MKEDRNGAGKDKRKGETPRVQALISMGALLGAFLDYWLLNYCAFPLFDTVYFWAREVSAIASGATLAILAQVAWWKPQTLDIRLFSWGVIALMASGCICIFGSVFLKSAVLVSLGASLVTIASGLANICAGLACIRLRLDAVALIVTLAYVFSYILRFPLEAVNTNVCLALFFLLPVLCAGIAVPYARKALEDAKGSESPAQMAVTSPRSFLPFSHQLFLTIVIFRIIYGFTLTFGEVDRVPVSSIWAILLLAFLLVPTSVTCFDNVDSGSRLARIATPDALLKAAILFSAAGFLFVSISQGTRNAPTQALLSTGTGYLEILTCYALVAIGTRNPAGALPALAWGNALSSWGTILGAALGRAANGADATALSIISSVIVLSLLSYALFALPHLSFSHIIESVEPQEEAPQAQSSPEQLVIRCDELGKKCSLTERETEVLKLLARGRNARFIQEALSISYSTTKTHVSRIYRKLGVHSHQELINLVDSDR